MGTLNILGAETEAGRELLRLLSWHPHLSPRAVAPAHARESWQSLHPSLWGCSHEAVYAEPEGDFSLDAAHLGHGGALLLPELGRHEVAPHCASEKVHLAFLALEPLLAGRVVSPKEPIVLDLQKDEIETLQGHLTGFFELRSSPAAEAHQSESVTELHVPLFEGYSEHDALAVYRERFGASPWIGLFRNSASVPAATPRCDLEFSVLTRHDSDNPLPLLRVRASWRSHTALAARLVSCINIGAGHPPLLGLLPERNLK